VTFGLLPLDLGSCMCMCCCFGVDPVPVAVFVYCCFHEQRYGVGCRSLNLVLSLLRGRAVVKKFLVHVPTFL
jgi:hypothetical protein